MRLPRGTETHRGVVTAFSTITKSALPERLKINLIPRRLNSSSLLPKSSEVLVTVKLEKTRTVKEFI